MKKLTLLFCGILLLSSAAAAINYQEPASLLVYPFFSTNPGEETIISVTNVNVNNIYNYNTGHLWGDVYAHFFYVDEDTCDVTNRRELLTPGDIFTILASVHNPAMNRGFLLVIAEDANTRMPITWDGIQDVEGYQYVSGLIGDAMVANGVLNFLWAIPAIGVKTQGDDAVGDRVYNLAFGDPQGYESLPRFLMSSSFLEQDFLGTESTLVLVSPILETEKIDLYFLFYDNDENELSQTTTFECFLMEKLLDIFGGADDVNTANAVIPTGWFKVRATLDDVPTPILGMLIQEVVSTWYSSARLLHHFGGGVCGEINF